MSPDTADLPAALQSAPCSLASRSGRLAVRTDRLCTYRRLAAATPYGKRLVVLAVTCALAGLSGYQGFALPTTPQPLQIHEAGIKPGGFLPGMFQVSRNNYLQVFYDSLDTCGRKTAGRAQH